MARNTTSRDLRLANRAHVLHRILTSGATTRAELIAQLGLSGGTVSNVITELLAEGVLIQGGSLESDGGRPRITVMLNPAAGSVIGVDVGESGTVAELFDLRLNKIDEEQRAVPAATLTPQRAIDLVTEAVDALRARSANQAGPLLGLGIGVPGVVTADHEVHAKTLGWARASFAELEAVFGVRTVVANGAKAMTQAEMWFGAAAGVDHAVVVLLGHGIGAGIISDGALLRGVTTGAGEFGHTKVTIGGPSCRCGGQGCVEAVAGAAGLVRTWREHGGPAVTDDRAGVSALLAAVAKGDSAAHSVLVTATEALGVGLSNLVNLYNPQKIIIGGWIGLSLPQQWIRRIETVMQAHALDLAGSGVTVELCTLGPDAVALGAATLPLTELIDSGFSPRRRRSAAPAGSLIQQSFERTGHEGKI